MENYHVNRSCGRPYHATCGMAKAQMAARSSSCPCTEQHKNQSCACRMPNTVTINPEMYTHADHMEPAMAYVPCQQLTTTYDLCYALNVGTIFSANFANHFAEREVDEDDVSEFFRLQSTASSENQ